MSAADRPRGFTLLEVMAALAVLGLVLVAALAAAAADLRASHAAAAHIEAAALAAEVLARFETYGPDPIHAFGSEAGGVFDSPMQHFRWDARASEVGQEPGLADVRIIITWPGGSLPIHTRVARPVDPNEAD